MDTATLHNIKLALEMAINFQQNNIKRDEYMQLAALIGTIMHNIEEQKAILNECIIVSKETHNHLLVSSFETLINKLYSEYGALDAIRRSIEILVNR